MGVGGGEIPQCVLRHVARIFSFGVAYGLRIFSQQTNLFTVVKDANTEIALSLRNLRLGDFVKHTKACIIYDTSHIVTVEANVWRTLCNVTSLNVELES